MEERVEVYQTHDSYVFVKNPCALFIDRNNGSATFKSVSKFNQIPGALNLGCVEGILGKFQCEPSDIAHLLLVNESQFVCSLHDGIEVRRISKISVLPISSSPLPKSFQINIPRSRKEPVSTTDQLPNHKQLAIVQAVQNTIKAASDIINFKQKAKRSKRFDARILEELEKLFEGESDQFYFSNRGGDLTLWTQRREYRRLQGELCDWSDLKTCPRTYWRPVWCRYDESFVWNHRILQDLVASALQYLHLDEGLPESFTPPESPFIVDEDADLKEDKTMPKISEGVGQRTQLTDCLCALESMLLPVISGFVKQQKLALCAWDVDGRTCPNEADPVALTIISRRSQFRAGCRYRRRGIDEKGYVANYVETEQVLEVPSDVSVHVLSFLQIRGSVPVFWTQTGIKYKPPIQLHRSLLENREAFLLHIERPLRKFDHLVVVNLVETAPGRQESKITEAYVRQLLLFNSAKVTYVGFDFHEYCKGLRFGNVSILLEGVKDIIRDMKYCWLHRDYFMCRQESVFRVNCVDCLDRTNLVQSVFATAVTEMQLRKLGRLPPDVDLPVEFSRALQMVWADNGDALSRHYTGTAAMKGDYTRTGFRTVNGLMKDGVSSMSRYYQRFGEIKRQAAIDFLLGHTNSPELRFLRNCSTTDESVQTLSNIEASSFLAIVRSSCIQSDEDSFFEFVASSTVRQPRRAEVRALGMLTSKYLHIVRFVDDPGPSQQAHLRIPIRTITHVALDTEFVLFKQASPVLHIHFTAALPTSHRHAKSQQKVAPKETNESGSGDEASGESAVSPPSTALGRPAHQQGTGSRYRLDLRQPPFRLFNNYLIPITSVEEATDALRAVAESVTALLQSFGVPQTRVAEVSVIQRRFALYPPAEYSRSLEPAVCDALKQYREHLRPFLLPLRRPWRYRGVPVEDANCSPRPIRRLRISNAPNPSTSTAIASSQFKNAPISSPPQKLGTECLGKAAPTETDEPISPESDTEGDEESTGEGESPERGIDETAVHMTKPTYFSSISDLIYELEDAASVAVDGGREERSYYDSGDDDDDDDDNGDDDSGGDGGDGASDGRRLESKISLNYASPVSSHLEHTNHKRISQEFDDAFGATRLSPSPLMKDLLRPPHLPLFSDGPKRSVKSAVPLVRQSRPVSADNQLALARSLSCDDSKTRIFHHLIPPRRGISDPQIACYRALYGLASEQESQPKSPHVCQGEIEESLHEQLRHHFKAFTIAQVDGLREASNPRFVSRLRQRQEANASAINNARRLISPSGNVIQTQFIVF